MTIDNIFDLSSLLVMPFWFLMAFVPTWKWTKRIIASPWIIAPAAILYAIFVIPDIGGILPAVLDPQLGNIASSLGTPEGATVGWVHFLAFDLFVGRWIYLDSRSRNINPFLMFPFIFFTLMLGPIGFLSYLILRLFSRNATETNQSAITS